MRSLNAKHIAMTIAVWIIASGKKLTFLLHLEGWNTDEYLQCFKLTYDIVS